MRFTLIILSSLVWLPSTWGFVTPQTSSSSTSSIPRRRTTARYATKSRLQPAKKTTKAAKTTTTSTSTTTETDKPAMFMPDLTQFLRPSDSPEELPTKSSESDNDNNNNNISITVLGTAAVLAGGVWATSQTIGLDTVYHGLEQLVQNPTDTFAQVNDYVQQAGPAGPLIFGAVYTVAEILAVPAVPLTVSAGYLFGFQTGLATVLVAATLAASVGFGIGKFVLRQWVETAVLAKNPDLRKLDRAIGREGFRLLFLVRLSPVFPFALSNYVYGASSIAFVPYFWGTLLGFAPGTAAYVYTGMVGQALTSSSTSDDVQPWYVYAGGLVVVAGLLRLVSDVASEIIESMEDDDDDDAIA